MLSIAAPDSNLDVFCFLQRSVHHPTLPVLAGECPLRPGGRFRHAGQVWGRAEGIQGQFQEVSLRFRCLWSDCGRWGLGGGQAGVPIVSVTLSHQALWTGELGEG